MPKSNKKVSKIYMDFASGVNANTGALHEAGVRVRAELGLVRVKVAEVLHARQREVIFTSSGTESNNLAILGVLESSKIKNPHIVTTAIEHASVLDLVRTLREKKRISLTIVPVDANGLVDPKKIFKAIKKNTVLVSVMYANNEVGVIEPIREIAKEVRRARKLNNSDFPLLHTDATAGENLLDLSVEHLGVDLLSLSGAKLAGALGAGVLFKKYNVTLEPVFYGGSQEWGLRPGTENLPAIVNFASELERVQEERQSVIKKMHKLKKKLLSGVKRIAKKYKREIVINGDISYTLPNILNVTFHGIPSDLLVIEFSERGVYLSSKSACKEGDGKTSHVLKALNPKIKDTDGSVRFSFGQNVTEKDITRTINALGEILHKLAKWYH